MDKRDYYEVLGISKNASEGDMKKAYRRLAMKFHPDRNSGDAETEQKFKEAKEAYEVLSNAQKRAAYDQFGHAGVNQSVGGGAGGAGFGDIFEDIFGDIFGGGRGNPNRAYRGGDLQYSLGLSLEEAVFGTESTINIPTKVSCELCGGNGAKPGSQPQACTTCGGVGQVRMQQGFFSVQQTCPRCRGNGKVISDPCTSCRGQGRVQKDKTLSVNVPAGVDTGDRIRLSGEGEAGVNGGPSGDLFVQIQVKPHRLFRRESNDLKCEVPVSFVTAAIGGDLEVPTLNGRVRLKIPAETQTGKSFRIKGKGVKPVRGGAEGDMICEIVVETPVNLTREQKELLREFDASMREGGKRHSPKEDGWMDGVKGFFEDLKFWAG